MNAEIIEHVYDYVKIIEHLADGYHSSPQFIYRGQGKESYNLIPSVFRRYEEGTYGTAHYFSTNVYENERGIVQDFMTEAASLIQNIPIEDRFSWVEYGQHFGIPTSQSHALIAGISGAAIALQGNFSGVNFEEWKKVLYGVVIVNFLAFSLGFIITKLIEKICKSMDRRKTNKFFNKTQILGAIITCFMNGAQDGQKFMAILLLGVVLTNGNSQELANFSIPIWLMFYCSILIALGTIIGGIKIIKTIGTKVAKVEKYQGTSADLASSICLLGSSILGIPVSSTHTKNSAVMGVGASKRLSNVNWKTARNMVLTWIFTFPCCGLLGFILTKVFIYIF